jgi:hypothetical protein
MATPSPGAAEGQNGGARPHLDDANSRRRAGNNRGTLPIKPCGIFVIGRTSTALSLLCRPVPRDQLRLAVLHVALHQVKMQNPSLGREAWSAECQPRRPTIFDFDDRPGQSPVWFYASLEQTPAEPITRIHLRKVTQGDFPTLTLMPSGPGRGMGDGRGQLSLHGA